MPIVLIVFRQVCVMALLIAAGWLLGRLGLLDKAGNAQLSNVLTGFIIPVVIFSAFVSLEATPAGLQKLGWAVLLFGFSFGFSMLVSVLLFRKRQDVSNAVRRSATVFTNNGFFGIPVVQALFGDLGVFYASISVMYSNMIMWTWGAAQFQPGQKLRARDILTRPAALAAMAGLVVFCLRLSPLGPLLGGIAWLENITDPILKVLDAIKATNTPIAMMVLGVNIYYIKIKCDRTLLGTLPFVAMRQFLLPFAILLCIRWLPVDPILLFSVFVTASCPIAMLTSVMALRYGAPPDQQRRATQTVVVSTLSALATVPLMVALGSLFITV